MRRELLRMVGLLLSSALLVLSSTARADDDSKPALELGENPAETYELNAIGLIHVGAADEDGTWLPALGKYRRSMTYEQFYTAVGRPDLAEDHARRRGLSQLMFFGGWGIMIGGGVLFFAAFEEGEPTTLSWVGAGAIVGGFGVTLISSTVDDLALTEKEAQRLALDHNSALRQRLRLGPLPASWAPAKRSGLRLALVPRIAPTSTGLRLVAEF